MVNTVSAVIRVSALLVPPVLSQEQLELHPLLLLQLMALQLPQAKVNGVLPKLLITRIIGVSYIYLLAFDVVLIIQETTMASQLRARLMQIKLLKD